MSELLVLGAATDYVGSLSSAAEAGVNEVRQEHVRNAMVFQTRMEQAQIRNEQRRVEARIINEGTQTGIISQINNDANLAIMKSEFELRQALNKNREETKMASNEAILASAFKGSILAGTLYHADMKGDLKGSILEGFSEKFKKSGLFKKETLKPVKSFRTKGENVLDPFHDPRTKNWRIN